MKYAYTIINVENVKKRLPFAKVFFDFSSNS